MLGAAENKGNQPYSSLTDKSDPGEYEVRGYIYDRHVTSRTADCLNNMKSCLNDFAHCACRSYLPACRESVLLKLKNILSYVLVPAGAGVAAGFGTIPASVPLLAVSVPIVALSIVSGFHRQKFDAESVDRWPVGYFSLISSATFYGVTLATILARHD